jgi:hypothetical protein
MSSSLSLSARWPPTIESSTMPKAQDSGPSPSARTCCFRRDYSLANLVLSGTAMGGRRQGRGSRSEMKGLRRKEEGEILNENGSL